ncbi:hypothetical protein [Alteraurantiacibacter aquimixticola]|uniref:Uncharacterized protein n=1 Tax=Alteraurantiacibacter aquimixticola TaxID=2489173 RepID=A0A4V4U8R4_9SPHN|nr:hypothetical protein [Alteraurantiacibacter aquimixticola]TIX51007.1 hypothetical protein E5222_00530 [Alteraurantiacibacter aquimixticola]
MTIPQTASEGRGPLLYIVLFVLSAAIVSALRLTDAINPGTAYLLFIASMGFMALSVRAMVRKGSPSRASKAIRRYSKGMLATSLGYVLGLGAAITLDQRFDIAGPLAFVIALLPVIPIFGMIYVMGRYLVEEQDEYLRHRATIASLVGLACVLGFGSFWGFLEGFELVPHAPGWWAVPVWAVGMGLAQAWMSFTDRAEPEADGDA